jgi:proline dehydrogenase
MLGDYKVKVILDYAVEGKEGEENFEHACNEFIRVINYAATQAQYPVHECEDDRNVKVFLIGKNGHHDAPA